MLDVQYIIGLEEHVELHDPLLLTRDEEDKDNHNLLDDEDQPNTKRHHANDPLEVPIGPITKARAKKLKEALNGLIHNIWSKMDLEGLNKFKEHEEQPLIHLIMVQEEPNSCGTRG